MLHYFAYGSNLHPLRLARRVDSAELVETATLPGHRLAFHKAGQDGSGKCDIPVGVKDECVHGAIYRIHPHHKPVLDRYEGCGNGYIDQQLTVTSGGREIECFVYVAQDSHVQENLQPFCWYKQLVLLGAQYHGFPSGYIERLSNIPSITDPDVARNKINQDLVQRIMHL